MDLELQGHRMCALIENSYIICEDKKLSVTISIGATLMTGDDTVARLINRADTLLYKSKAAGRNCVTLG
jgi:diguanylate cyclase (GGDEF)-like protein